MASTLNALICALAAAALWTCIGLPLARRLLPGAPAMALAPSLGWAIHSALALPLFSAIGMPRVAVIGATIASLAAAAAALFLDRRGADDDTAAAKVPIWAFAGAALLACGIAAAILPKVSGDNVALAAPIFDHSKIALIDEMVRLGVPAGNPFIGEPGTPARVAYYYLWHFSAAELALLLNVSGWEADAGLTWFTAFASLALMMGLAVWLAERAAAAWWVLLLAATASLRPLISLVLGTDRAYALIGWSTGFAGWPFQSAWAPQHVAGALCCMLSILLMAQLAQRRTILGVLGLGLVAAAGYQSSAWVGGILFPSAAVIAGVVLFIRVPSEQRGAFVGALVMAAIVAGGLAAPFLYDQSVATALRGSGSPIAIRPYPVLGEAFSEGIRRVLDLPAYWLLLLVIEFPAIYPAGVAAMVSYARDRALTPDRKCVATALIALVATSLLTAWLLASIIGDNNDLGWRAVLPGVMGLIVFAAAGFVRWRPMRRPLASAAAGAALLLGLIEGVQLIAGNFAFEPQPDAKIFAATPAMWAAVRKHSGTTERVASNPLFLQDMTPWPANISWALLANRRSCYAGKELALPFAPVSAKRRADIEAQFVRVFAGNPEPNDLEALAARYNCRVILVTAQDGAWARDPFEASGIYRLVETQPGAWRIYRPITWAGNSGDNRSR